MFARIAGAFRYNSALDHAAAGNYADALRALDSIPAKFWNIAEPRTLRMVILRAVGDSEGVLDGFDELISLIENSRMHSKIEKIYLQAFVRFLGVSEYVRLQWKRGHPEHEQIDIPEKFGVDWDTIDLAKVPGYLKRNFPLRTHPSWAATTPDRRNGKEARH